MSKSFKGKNLKIHQDEVEDHWTLVKEVRRINRKIRERNLQPRDSGEKDKPVRYWTGTEVTALQDKIKQLNALTIVLATQGCEWAIQDPGGGCIFCGYLYDNPASTGDLVQQIKFIQEEIKKEERKKIELIKLFTSGSFLDTREISISIRGRILRKLFEVFPNVKVFQMEARPEDLLRNERFDALQTLQGEGRLTYVNLGLESANEDILHLINKGLRFSTYRKAVKIAKNYGFRIKTYLLLKPPFLSEKEAIQDALFSGRQALQTGSDTLSINPLSVHSGTFVEKLWKNGLYRPPWPQSLIYVLQQLLQTSSKNQVVISEPVAFGRPRGIHGVGTYTNTLKQTLEKIVCTQDHSVPIPEDTLASWKQYLQKRIPDLSYSQVL